MADLEQFINEIRAYNQVLFDNGFLLSGTGVRAWSNRHTNADKTLHVDVRATEWVVYDKDDKPLVEGHTPQELAAYMSPQRH